MAPWASGYVGIPYAARGRTREGIDCWGLVRIVYLEQFGIALPSGTPDYDPVDGAEVAGIFAGPEREEWHRIEVPEPGDVVLLRVLGYPSHIGILVEPGAMLHCAQGHDSVIERIDRGGWRHRVDGYYRHTARDGAITVSGVPHPLHTRNITALALEGTTLRDIIQTEAQRAGVPEAIAHDGHAWIDGEYIPAEEWATYRPRKGQRVEYRVLPAGKALNAILKIILVIVAVVVSVYTGNLAIGAKIIGGGFMAVDLIAPIRPPKPPESSGPGTRREQLQGGQNVLTPFGSIPVVLGRFRFTPPLGAQQYVESDSQDTYLRQVLCWGYGPLLVNDLRIGDTLLADFEDIEIKTLPGRTAETQAARDAFNAIYGQDVSQTGVYIKLETNVQIDRTISDDVDYIIVTLHFPNGLWFTPLGGRNGGAEGPLDFHLDVSARTTPAGTWYRIDTHVWGDVFDLPDSYAIEDNDGTTIPVWTWHTIAIDQYGSLVLRSGTPTDSQYAEPSTALIDLLKEQGLIDEWQFDWIGAGGGIGIGTIGGIPIGPQFTRLPAARAGETVIHQVCIQDGAIVVAEDKRPTHVTGCALTYSGAEATVASGDIDRSGTSQVHTVTINRMTKDSFDIPIRFRVAHGAYDVRVELFTPDESDGMHNEYDAAFYRDCYYTTLTGIANQRPITPPAKLALTALRIRASNQLNGVIDGITGTAMTICKDWNGAAWVTRHTRNPASLFRHVLQHPGNAQPASDAEIDLSALQTWHTFCVSKGFRFDTVLLDARPVLDVLRDIAAAGRASPALRDGVWTVIVDDVRTTVVQHFTPHNSWGFQGTKLLPVIPHALRVRFFNAAKGYQIDERVVYADGYTAANATLYEQVEFPGVTNARHCYRLGRFHLAQMILRPERYTLNCDMEHLIATRGDLVRATHEVPLWGLGSGRITAIGTSGPNDTTVTVDEEWPMKASGASYQIRFRLDTGATLVKAVNNPGGDGNYRTLTFTTPFTSGTIKVGDLALFGEVGTESSELIVTTIEPNSKGNARLTMVDYAPGVFTADTEEIPAWESNITLPPTLAQRNPASTHIPDFSSILTDDAALVRTAEGNLQAGMLVSYRGIGRLGPHITHVEFQYARSATNLHWIPVAPIPVRQRSVWIGPLREGRSYYVRARYVTRQGLVGPWTTSTPQEIIGRRGAPDDVTNLRLVYEDNIGLTLDWDDSPDADFRTFIVRRVAGAAANWDGGTLVKNTPVSQHRLGFLALGAAYVYMVKARDVLGNFSVAEASVAVAVEGPTVSALTASVIDHTVTLRWTVTRKTYPVTMCEIRSGGTTWETSSPIGQAQGDTFVHHRTFGGMVVYRVKAIDAGGNASDDVAITVRVRRPVDHLSLTTFAGTLQ